MTYTLTVNEPMTPPRTYTGSDLPELIRRVLLTELDLAPVDLALAPEEFPYEILAAWTNPTLDNLEYALSPFATLEHTY
jgi:hypothetical protein